MISTGRFKFYRSHPKLEKSGEVVAELEPGNFWNWEARRKRFMRAVIEADTPRCIRKEIVKRLDENIHYS